MLSKIRASMRRDEGFTLIELLLVIIILAILAAIVVFAVSGVADRGQTSACKTEKRTVEAAQEAHYAKNSSYAASAGALVTAGFLRGAPAWHTTSSSGAVVGGAPCPA